MIFLRETRTAKFIMTMHFISQPYHTHIKGIKMEFATNLIKKGGSSRTNY